MSNSSALFIANNKIKTAQHYYHIFLNLKIHNKVESLKLLKHFEKTHFVYPQTIRKKTFNCNKLLCKTVVTESHWKFPSYGRLISR